MGTEWERDGNGVGVGTGTPFRDKPPPPPVVSKGCVESGEFNKRGTSRQPGGLISKGVSVPTPTPFPLRSHNPSIRDKPFGKGAERQ